VGIPDKILDGKLDVATWDDYDIATALRGPDIQCLPSLKKVLVCRLRTLVGAAPYYTPSLHTIREAVTEWKKFRKWVEGIEDPEVSGCLLRSIGHWVHHLLSAYGALIQIAPDEKEELEFLRSITWSLYCSDGTVIVRLEAYADYIKEQGD
jgi:hypothetical protein